MPPSPLPKVAPHNLGQGIVIARNASTVDVLDPDAAPCDSLLSPLATASAAFAGDLATPSVGVAVLGATSPATSRSNWNKAPSTPRDMLVTASGRLSCS